MALTETRPDTGHGDDTVVVDRPAPTQIERLVATGDHLSNGRLQIGFSLVFLAVSALGLGLAALDRVTDDGLLGGIAEPLWASSLVGLVLMGVVPLLLGLAIYVVPLQLGSPAIAFPRAASLSMWSWLVGAVLFVTSVVLDGGVGGSDDDGARIGNLSMGLMMVALSLGAVCVATTVMSHRPLGMKLARVPFFSWSMLVAAPIWILTFASAVAHIFVGQITQADAEALSANFDAGVSWMLRSPSIYMLAIPVLGIAADVVVHLTGRRLAAYGALQGAIAAFGVLSFGAWAQSSPAGQTIIWVVFAVAAGLPLLAMLGGLGDALRRGRVPAAAALGAAVLAHLLVLGAVLAAALQALDTAGSGDLFGLGTDALEAGLFMFVVSGAALGGIAGVLHWGERIFGAPAKEALSGVAGAALLLGGGLMATVLLVESIAQAARNGLVAGVLYGAVAVGAALFLVGVLGALVAVLGAARTSYEGSPAEGGDVIGSTLEWSGRGVALPGGPSTELAAVGSPYPLLDLRDGGVPDEETK
jgi:hypothetical protein